MHVKSLKIFCDTVSLRSFSKAADANGVSQSNASHVVHQLEERLGVQLIDRSTRPFGLTPEGQRYYEGCRGIVRRYLDLEEEVRSMHDVATTRLTVAAIYSVGFGHMTKCLEAFRAEHPQVDVRIDYYHPPRVYAAVDSGEADLGLVGHPEESRQIAVTPWRDERLVIAVSPRHALATADAAPLDALAGERFVTFDRSLKLRGAIDDQLHRRGIEVDIVAEFDNIETAKRAIEVNDGVGVLPAPTIATEVAEGKLVGVAIEGPPLVRPMGVLFRRDREVGEPAELFIDHLRSCAATSGAASAGVGDDPARVALTNS